MVDNEGSAAAGLKQGGTAELTGLAPDRGGGLFYFLRPVVALSFRMRKGGGGMECDLGDLVMLLNSWNKQADNCSTAYSGNVVEAYFTGGFYVR